MAATATQLRTAAARMQADATASHARCGTDGALTQVASRALAGQYGLQAEILDRGGVWEFAALFDLNGNPVPAKLVTKDLPRGGTRRVWMLLNDKGRCAGWFNPSQAENVERRRANDAKKGFYVGRVLAPAKAEMGGSHITTVRRYAARTDGGYSANLVVLDNGVDDRAQQIARYRALWADHNDPQAYREMVRIEQAAHDGGWMRALFDARRLVAIASK
ncbi:hypothetical protein [Parafrankia sp. EUN1f]|uniref:hypothetical protein n=1 Tax=Parafrankia sp. EUN1f TaxID=102897 RepID=UPI0001C46CFF|nr:hypothetical protein [Parafrankia sp. EUN1f]EFC80174.1 hypothetical protein FrEUN1fDRAFT_6703 [Parafrankia sp. EUN1f]